MPATTDAVENYINSHQQEFIDDLRRVVTAETPSNDKALLDSGLEVIRHTVISVLENLTLNSGIRTPTTAMS